MKGPIVVILLAALSSSICAQQDSTADSLPPYAIKIDGSENKAAIPLADSAIAYLRIFLDLERQAPGRGAELFAKQHAVDISEAQQFIEDLPSAYGELDEQLAMAEQQFCAASYTTPESWAAAMLMQDQRNDVARVDFLSRLEARSNGMLWANVLRRADAARASSVKIITDRYRQVEHEDYQELYRRQCAR